MMGRMLVAVLMVAQGALRLEGEDAARIGAQIATAREGFGGRGYVTGFEGQGASLTWKLDAPKAGLYTVHLRYATPGGYKEAEIETNGAKTTISLPASGDAFAERDVARVELKAGDNTIKLLRGWGYYDIDWLEFSPAPAPKPLKPVPAKLSDPNATPATKALMARLVGAYGKGMLSGQYDKADTDYVISITGKRPAIFGGDLIEFSPTRREHGSKVEGTVENWLAQAKSGAVITLSWHWNAPTGLIDKKTPDKDLSWYRGFYTEATTFDIEAALREGPTGANYKLLLRDIDAIAIPLKKLAAAKIPVLWRPLHEAEGGWFWWGAKGPKPCLELWRLLRQRLINYHHLHNLVWVWNSIDPEWYPGGGTVDVVAVDKYPSDRSDPLASVWDGLIPRFDGKKLLAVGEFPGPVDVPKAFRFGAKWAYFVSWTGDLGPRGTDKSSVQRIYRSNLTRNADK